MHACDCVFRGPKTPHRPVVFACLMRLFVAPGVRWLRVAEVACTCIFWMRRFIEGCSIGLRLLQGNRRENKHTHTNRLLILLTFACASSTIVLDPGSILAKRIFFSFFGREGSIAWSTHVCHVISFLSHFCPFSSVFFMLLKHFVCVCVWIYRSKSIHPTLFSTRFHVLHVSVYTSKYQLVKANP